MILIDKIDKIDLLTLKQIKMDADALKRLLMFVNKKNYSEIFSINVIPYISLFVYESYSFMQKLFKDIKFPENTSYSLEDIRLKCKIFDDKLNKNKNIIENIDYIQNCEFKNLLKFNFLKNLNINDNIGVYLNDGHVIGNTHLFYFFFQPKVLKKPIHEIKILYKNGQIETRATMGEKCYDYSCFLGESINSMAYALDEINTYLNVELSDLNYPIMYKDFNTVRNLKLFKGTSSDKFLSLYLLYLLSMINFISYVWDKIFISDSGYSLRVKYICCYYVIKSLEKIQNYLYNSNLMTKEITEFYKQLDVKNTKTFDTNFRNCMMHYSFKNKDGKSIITDKNIDINKPFFGLIESCYSGIDYNKLKSNIDKKLITISKVLETWLNIKIEKPQML